MNPQIEKDDELENYDDAEELRRLTRSIELAEKHFLFFACCNPVPKQNEFIEKIKQSLPAKQIEVISFKEPIINLLEELRRRLNKDKTDAIFVQGLERSISSDEDANNPVVINLNHFRDSFREFLSCPLVLWLPEYAIVKITNNAPDFFSVRSGTFYFSSTPEKLTEQIFQSTLSSFKEVSSLPVAEKLKRVETLEKLLLEYESLPKTKRDLRAETRLKENLAEVFYSISNFRKAIEYLERQLQIKREIGDRLGEGASLGNLGNAYHSLGDYRKAIEYYEQHLNISREIGNRLGEGTSLGNLGNAYFSLGDYRKAIEYHEQHLNISREIGNRLGEGDSLGNLGNAYFSLGDYRKAIEYHEQALEIDREIGNRQGEGTSLGNLGIAYFSLGDYRKAIEYHEQHLNISREIGNRQGEGNSLGNLGIAYDSLGDYRKAIEYHEQHLNISREIGNRQGEGNSLGNLGIAYDMLGETEKACSLGREALTIFESIESPNANVIRLWLSKNCQSGD